MAEVLATLPAWGALGMLYTLAAFVTLALLWAHFSVLDVVVAARGALAPEGYVQPVQARAGGRVLYVLAREGDTVRKGQVLLQLDRTKIRAGLDAVRGSLRTSEREWEQLRATGAPLNDVLEAEGRVLRLRGDIPSAEEALAQTAVTAPVGGVLTELAVRGEGAVLQPGQTVGAVAPEGAPLVARAYLPNRDIGWVRPGLPAKLKLDAFPFQDYGTVPGTVSKSRRTRRPTRAETPPIK
jgi:multidrug efflux pump subunit AcrA (membrane-fusion protein)